MKDKFFIDEENSSKLCSNSANFSNKLNSIQNSKIIYDKNIKHELYNNKYMNEFNIEESIKNNLINKKILSQIIKSTQKIQ